MKDFIKWLSKVRGLYNINDKNVANKNDGLFSNDYLNLISLFKRSNNIMNKNASRKS